MLEQVELHGSHRGELADATWVRGSVGWSVVLTLGEKTSSRNVTDRSTKPCWSVSTQMMDQMWHGKEKPATRKHARLAAAKRQKIKASGLKVVR